MHISLLEELKIDLQTNCGGVVWCELARRKCAIMKRAEDNSAEFRHKAVGMISCGNDQCVEHHSSMKIKM